MYNYKFLTSFLILLFVFKLNAIIPNPGDSIDPDFVNWYNLDLDNDKVLGASVEKTYTRILKDKPAKKTIVVAVIDAGVDIYHEDLKEVIWINEGEIPDNGIDDDKNGYIDDIHGWNFLGAKDGKNINTANLEMTRVIREYQPIFDRLGENIPDSLVEEYEMYNRCLKAYDEEYEGAKDLYDQYSDIKKYYLEQESLVKAELKKDTLRLDDIVGMETTNKELLIAQRLLTYVYKHIEVRRDLFESYRYFDVKINKYLNLEFDPRSIIGDDITDLSDVHGNNDVKGPASGHGTLVAGVIAAQRNNGIGVNGISDAARIMVLRTVPDGDEYDKDVALSIIYAVDNGADIINMSFGKDFSPQKHLVDKALKYAAEHNVLLVHAAGNDGANLDDFSNFPTPYYGKNDTLQAWLTVGANDRKKNKKMVAVFSNYGQKTVDIFAPGVNIVSTLPEDRYEVTNGTSFAGPVVSGVAALIWSRYPDMTAKELYSLLMRSTNAISVDRKVFQPLEGEGKRSKVRFNTLSQTGGIVNAYRAFQIKTITDSKLL